MTSKCWQSWFLQGDVREGSVPGLSPWLTDDYPLPVPSPCLPSVPACVPFPLLIRTLVVFG